jgi:hypothetical protein
MLIQQLLDEASLKHQSVTEVLLTELEVEPTFFDSKVIETLDDILSWKFNDSIPLAIAEATYIFNRLMPIINYITAPTSIDAFCSKKTELLQLYHQLHESSCELKSFYDGIPKEEAQWYLLHWLSIITDTMGITNEYEGAAVNVRTLAEISWMEKVEKEPGQEYQTDKKIITLENAIETARIMKYDHRYIYTLCSGKFRLGPSSEHIDLLEKARLASGLYGKVIVAVESKK